MTPIFPEVEYKIECNGVEIGTRPSTTEDIFHKSVATYCDGIIETDWTDRTCVVLSHNECKITISINWVEGIGEIFYFNFDIPKVRSLIPFLFKDLKMRLGLNSDGSLEAYPTMVSSLIIDVKNYLLHWSLSDAVQDVFSQAHLNRRVKITVDEIKLDPLKYTDSKIDLVKEYARSLI